MASNMANLLMQYGAELPNIIKSNRKTANDLETEKLRQALLQGQITESQLGSAFKQKQIDAADIANQSAVEEEQRKRQAREAMASALGSYASSKRTTGMAQDIAGMEQAAGLTPLASEKGFDKPISMREAAESAGVPKFAGNEDVKQFTTDYIKEPEKTSPSGMLSGGAVWTQRTNAYKANPDAIPALGRQIEKLRSSGIIDEANYEQFKRTYEIDPASVDIAINKIVGNPLVAAATVSATTQPKVEQKRALINPTAETTKANVIASNEGETESNQTAIPGFKPIQGVKITDDSVRKVKVAASQIEMMKSLADDLINKYNKMGSEFTGDDAADYSSKVRNLQLMAKGPEFYNLGVLTGPDLSLLEETIPNPSSIKEGVKKQVLGDISVKLNNFKNMLTQKGDQFYSLNGFEKEQPKKQKKVYNPQTGKFELR